MIDENKVAYIGSCDNLPRYCIDRFNHILKQNRIELEREKSQGIEQEELDGDGVTLEDLARLRIN